MRSIRRLRFDAWIVGWLDMTSGFIRVVTYCWYLPNWSMLFILRGTKKDLKERINEIT